MASCACIRFLQLYKNLPLQLDIYLFTQRKPPRLDLEVCFLAESVYLSTPAVHTMVRVRADPIKLYQTFPAGDQQVEVNNL